MTAVGMTAHKLRLRGLVTALVLLPLVIPYIVLAVGLLILLNWLGLERSLWAVLLGHIAVSVPYCLLIILPRLRTLDQAIVDAARDLGAGPWTAFRRVTLPLIVPALFSSALDRLHDLVRRVRDRLVPRPGRRGDLPGLRLLGSADAGAPAADPRARLRRRGRLAPDRHRRRGLPHPRRAAGWPSRSRRKPRLRARTRARQAM